tara:strand:- start:123 stop:308 length:186 start_codon:yes stop_codon:yes gene_type:complete
MNGQNKKTIKNIIINEIKIFINLSLKKYLLSKISKIIKEKVKIGKNKPITLEFISKPADRE